MSTVPDFDICHEKFIDKTSIIYGESGTGKSFVIVDILHSLRPHIDQIVVIAPTDRQNHTYDKGIVPLPCIHYTITPKLLTDIWKRQEALAAVYTKSNKASALRSLFMKIPANRRGPADAVISEINAKLRTAEGEIRQNESDETVAKAKINEITDECNKLAVAIYKNYIGREANYLGRLHLTEDEQFSLKYHLLNPRIVIIFDDATDLIKKYRTHEVMQKIFYQGRHSFITAILAVHTDKVLDSELKKNAAVSVFTEMPCASAYITRASTSLDKESQSRALAACRIAFGDPTRKHQKLAYVRLEKKYYKFTAQKRDGFNFGSSIVKTFCKMIAAETGKVSADNQFIAEFQ